MLSRLMEFLGRFLYPRQFALVPGQFESFLSGVAILSDGDGVPPRRSR